MYKDSRIYIAGHRGLIGAALYKQLEDRGFANLLVRDHRELDLTVREQVDAFFHQEKPEYIFLAAGKVGGILDNKTYPADYFHTNISIQNHIFEAAVRCDVKGVVFYGSSCMYPKESQQPIKEDYLLTGPIELTSEGYAAAKIAGTLACKAYNNQYGKRFICLVPNSSYGPNDNFDLESSHVLSALIARFHKAKIEKANQIVLWGSGQPRREFVYCDDVAEASVFAMENLSLLENHHYNVGAGTDISIKELAEKIAQVVGYQGTILWDQSKPDGTMRKLLDGSKFTGLGWNASVDMSQGIEQTYQWYKQMLLIHYGK